MAERVRLKRPESSEVSPENEEDIESEQGAGKNRDTSQPPPSGGGPSGVSVLFTGILTVGVISGRAKADPSASPG